MKKSFSAVLAAVIIISAFSGCVATNSLDNKINPYPLVIRGVTISKSPEAVACLSPDVSDLIVEMGYFDRVTCISSDYVIETAEDAEDITSEEQASSEETTSSQEASSSEVSSEAETANTPVDIGTAMNPDIDAIIQAKPNVLITSVALTVTQHEKLEAAEIDTIVIPSAESLTEFYQIVTDLYNLFLGSVNGETESKNKISAIEAELEAIKAKIPTADRQSYIYIVSSDMLLSTYDTLESSLFSYLADNLVNADISAYDVTDETITALDPDIILYTSPLKEENIKTNNLFKDKKAVSTENGLINIDYSSLDFYTLDIADTAAEVAAVIYPDIDFASVLLSSSDTSTSDAASSQ